MSQVFDSALLKLYRAEQHIHTLEFEVKALRQGGFCSARKVVDEATDEDVWYAVVTEPPPRWWSLLAGDAIQNLRATLDHLIWAALPLPQRMTPKGELNRTIQFPVWDKADESEKPQGRSLLAKLRPDIRDRVLAVQPFNSTERPHPLSVLRDLSNTDKHRELTLTFPTPRIVNSLSFGVGLFTPFPLRGLSDVGNIQHNSELLRHAKGKLVDVAFEFDVAFEHHGPGQGLLLIEGLKRIAELIRENVLPIWVSPIEWAPSGLARRTVIQ